MGKAYEEQIQLKQRITQAQKQVVIGAQYRHYKGADKIYTIVNLAFQEADNELCIIYQAEYEERLIFIRPLASWLETVEWQGQTVPRFTRL